MLSNRGKRGKEGKPSPSKAAPPLTDIAQTKGFSTSAKMSKPAKAKVSIIIDKVKPTTSKTKQRAKSSEQAQGKVISSIQSRSSPDRQSPPDFFASRYQARGPADLLECSIPESSHGYVPLLADVNAATSSQKPKRSRRAMSKMEVAHRPCIEEDPLDAVTFKRPNKDLSVESLEDDDDPIDVSVSGKRVAQAKKVRKHVRVKEQGVHAMPTSEIKENSRTQSPAGEADAEISAHSSERQSSSGGKLSRRSLKVHAKARAPAVLESMSNVSSGLDVDGKCQVCIGEASKAAAEIPKVKTILWENSDLEFSAMHSTGKPYVNVQGLPNQEVAIEARHLFDELPVGYKVEVTDKNQATAMPVKEHGKGSLLVSFPIMILTRWWISCYMDSTAAVTDLTHPLRMTHVWVTAYQRAFLRMTGEYCDGETIRSMIEKLQNLKCAVVMNKFRWSDERNVYLSSPLTETAKISNSSEVVLSSTFQDDVVEEVLLLALEPIFEARFSARSHGFRPGRDAHTVLQMVQKSFQGCSWFISGSFNSREVYSTRILDSVIRVVRDMRVLSLVKGRLFRDKYMAMEELDKSGMGSNPDPFMRLKFLLCNVFLDQLDQWMERRICTLSEKKHLSFGSSPKFFFRPAHVTARKAPKMEYVRYGTSFLVGFCGSQKEAEMLKEDFLGFLNEVGAKLDRDELPLCHISDGVKFLDHTISQKVVRQIMKRHSASKHQMFEKRALRIRLFLKACKQSCLSYLHQIRAPTSFEELKEILLILNSWYRYAEDRVKIIEYCKVCLCSLYAKEVLREQPKLQRKAFLKMVLDPVKETDGVSYVGNCTSKDKVWLAKHELNLKELVWLQSEVAMRQVTEDIRRKSTLSPQQRTAQVVWDFLRDSYPFKK